MDSVVVESLSGSVKTACICAQLKQPRLTLPSYPEWRDGEDNVDKLCRQGYVVLRGLLSSEEVEETKQQISLMISEWYEQARRAGSAGTDLQEMVNMSVIPTIISSSSSSSSSSCCSSCSFSLSSFHSLLFTLSFFILIFFCSTCSFYFVFSLPEVKEGKLSPADPELAIRKLYRMCVKHQYFIDLCKHPKIVPIVTEVLGPDVKLLQSMALLKPPGMSYVHMIPAQLNK